MQSNNQSSDLITAKTAEFSNIPGLILGVDGWILRSLQKEQRAVFLNGYLKLLRIVFHPDRYLSPDAKASKEKYIQAVDQCVSYMLSSEIGYDFATENVPTKSNPMVMLQNKIEHLGDVINHGDDQSKELIKRISDQSEIIKTAKNDIRKQKDENEILKKYYESLRFQVKLMAKTFPVPIHHKTYTITGIFLDFLPLNLESTISKLIAGNAKVSEIFSVSRKLAIPKKEEIRISRGNSRLHGYVRAAFTLADICGFVSQAKSVRVEDLIHQSQKHGGLTMPFLASGMFLLIENDGAFRMFWLHDIDCAQNPASVLESTLLKDAEDRERKLEKRCDSLNKKISKQFWKIKELEKKLSETK